MGLFTRSKKNIKEIKVNTKPKIKKTPVKKTKKVLPKTKSKKKVAKTKNATVKKTTAKKNSSKNNSKQKQTTKKASSKLTKAVKSTTKQQSKQNPSTSRLKNKKTTTKKPASTSKKKSTVQKIHPKQTAFIKQREAAKHLVNKHTKDEPHSTKKAKKAKSLPPKKKKKEFVRTGIEGLDELIGKGIPQGSSILIAGGAGSGKTLLTLQTLVNNVKKGKKSLYVSFEESEDRLKEHLSDFGFNPDKAIKEGKLAITRFNPFEVTQSVDALLLKAKGELLIDIDPVIFPTKFTPEIIIVDSLTAIASAFVGKEDSYRIYIEQLFRFFEKINATVFLITETTQVPTVFSTTGVEEFLADGVIVLYNLKHGNVRERAIEILKLRGASHQKKIVAFEIEEKGLQVYPSQEIFDTF